MRLSLVVPAAGTGSRMGTTVSKPWLVLAGAPILEHTLRAFRGCEGLDEVVVAAPAEREADLHALMARALPGVAWRRVDGGAERMHSVRSALAATTAGNRLVAVHDAVRPFVSAEAVERVRAAAERHGAAVPAIPVADTIKTIGPGGTVALTLERGGLRAVQTPQIFHRDLLARAYAAAPEGNPPTDDAALVEAIGHPVLLVDGDPLNLKLTYPQDLRMAEQRLAQSQDLRIGYGYDVHRLAPGRRLVLGGVEIPHSSGLDGHSDADVLLHAVTDALLGALGLGDIGTHFPDTASVNKDRDSREFLRGAAVLIRERGYRVGNIDATLVAEKPKILPHVPLMCARIAEDVGIPADRVSVKATTNERMGFIGREEGMTAMATALLIRD